MRSLKIVLVMVAMSLLAFGCGKQSALEGKVVDGQGQPIGGLKAEGLHEVLRPSSARCTAGLATSPSGRPRREIVATQVMVEARTRQSGFNSPGSGLSLLRAPDPFLHGSVP